MPTNRLALDFTLSSTADRKKFVDTYVQRPEFTRKPLTEEELETIANYILWGKDEDGLNVTQRKEIQIETRNKTWQRDDTESLDALLESPTFNEATLRRPTEIRPKVVRENFDRQKTLRECPAHMRPIFEDLFARIDRIELAINLYEEAHGKRKEPPRASLLSRFTPEEIEAIRAATQKWNQFRYLKQRHLIVELRREQFTMRDQFTPKITRHAPIEPYVPPAQVDFDVEIPVFPLGTLGAPLADLAFKPIDTLNPSSYSEEELSRLVHFYWEKHDCARPQICFDFCELEHVYELFCQLEEVESTFDDENLESNIMRLVDTLKYYVELTDLTEVQREVLDLKIGKMQNQKIADYVNEKYGKSYTANYISTIFRQKIIPKINEMAAFHATVVENLCYPENFKRCNCCGLVLLMDAQNFVRKTRSKDGFSTRCKRCDRADRQRKKVN